MEAFVCPKCLDEKTRESFGSLSGIRNKRCKKCVAAAVRKTYANSSIYRMATKSKNRNTALKNQIYIFEYLSSHPCVDCGETDPVVLEFDHIVPEEKQYCVTAMYAMKRERIDEEIARCVVRCCNCHKRKTHGGLNSVRFQLSQTGIPADIYELIRTSFPKTVRNIERGPRVTGQQHPEIECSFCHKMFPSTYAKLKKATKGIDTYCSTLCSNGSKSNGGKKGAIIDSLKNNPEKRYAEIAKEFGVTDVYVGTIARKELGIKRYFKISVDNSEQDT